jgi:chromosome segregation ATPase
MAPKPVSIDVATDTRAFERGIDKGVIDPLDDVEKALDDVAKTSDDTGDDLADSMEQAQKATEKLQDTIKDGSAQKKFADNTKASTSQAEADLAELGDEAKANLAETVSSFDGSAESFIGALQGTFGGVVGSLGPMGAAAGAAAAIGVGLFTASMEKSKEKAQKMREKVADLADDLIETGGVGVHSIESITDAIKEMATQTDDAEQSLAKIADQAQDTGTDFQDLVAAFAGQPEALKRVEDQLTANIKAYNDSHVLFEGQEADYNDAAYQQSVRNQDLLKQLQDISTANEGARETELLWLNSGGPEFETKQKLVESIDDAYDDAANSVGDFIDQETGIFDVSKYIKSMEARSKSLKNYQDNLLKTDLSPEALSFITDQGADVAASMMDGYVKASPKEQQRLEAIWKKAAGEASGVVDTKITQAVSKSYNGPVIAPKVDSSKFDNYITNLQRNPPKIVVDVVARDGQGVK